MLLHRPERAIQATLGFCGAGALERQVGDVILVRSLVSALVVARKEDETGNGERGRPQRPEELVDRRHIQALDPCGVVM